MKKNTEIKVGSQKYIIGGGYWTDNPFIEMGDQPGKPAPYRRVVLLSVDSNKYAKVRLLNGAEAEVKLGYLNYHNFII